MCYSTEIHLVVMGMETSFWTFCGKDFASIPSVGDLVEAGGVTWKVLSRKYKETQTVMLKKGDDVFDDLVEKKTIINLYVTNA